MNNQRRIRIAIFLLAVCGVLTLRGRADDAPAPGLPSAVFARVSVGSASQVARLAGDLGIPLPAMLTAGGVEQMFPFLGQGGLNPDQPLTMDFIADGTNLTQAQRQVWYLPITTGKVPITDFLATGEKMGDDGALVNGTPFRRTDEYLMFGGTPATMAALKPSDMLKSLSDHQLFYAQYSAAHLRAADPKLFAEIKKSSEETTKNETNPGRAAGSEIASQFMFGSLESASFRIDRTQNALRLSAQVVPAPKFTFKNWQLPGMPQELAARADWQMPVGSVTELMKWSRHIDGDSGFFASAPDANTPEKRDKYFQLICDALEDVFGGEQCSIGLAKAGDDGFVVYVATQSAALRNSHDDFQKLADNLKPYNNKTEEIDPAVWFTHSGVRVERLSFRENGKLDCSLDAVDVNNTRLVTLSTTANTEMEKFLTSKSTQTTNAAAGGWVDLQALLEMRSRFGTPGPQWTSADVDLLTRIVAGQRISWNVTTDHDQLDVSTDLPMSLLKNAVANATQISELIGRLKDN